MASTTVVRHPEDQIRLATWIVQDPTRGEGRQPRDLLDVHAQAGEAAVSVAVSILSAVVSRGVRIWPGRAVELLGGLALLAGFFTRAAAALLAIEMVVAILFVNIKGGFSEPRGVEFPLTCWGAC